MNDSILFWNAVALEANRVSFSDPTKAQQQGPTLSSRALAIVHLAMYDAYARIENNTTIFPLYLSNFNPNIPGATDKQQAVAGAAYTTLVALYSAQKDFFDTQVLFFETNFAAPISAPNPPTASFQLGVAVARELLRIRANDPDAGMDGYISSTKRGRHRPDPDNPRQGFHAPFYGFRSRVFAVSQRVPLDPPPFEQNAASRKTYVNALQQVRAKGIKPDQTATLPHDLFDNRRTADESVIGVYWGYDGANRIGTPPRFYNQVVRRIALNPNMIREGEAAARINTEGENARLFAFVNAAMGDAGILCWQHKYCFDLWRPVLGIREHDPSFGLMPEGGNNNLDDDADPFWLPLGAPSTNSPTMKNMTPNFPSYPSGHATFGAAAFHITRLFYGKIPHTGATPAEWNFQTFKKGNLIADDLLDGLPVVSDEFNGTNQDNMGTVRPRHARSFDEVIDLPSSGGLGKMIVENARSRVYLGVHWVFDAFSAKGEEGINPDFSAAGLKIGGVPLGLMIAEDIFKTGEGKAPMMTTENPNTQPPQTQPEIPQPSKQTGCVEEQPTELMEEVKTKGLKKTKAAAPVEPEQPTEQKIETPFLSGRSER